MSAAPWVTDFLLIFLLVLFLFFLAWREDCHAKERRELYTRLMAKNLEEYIALTERPNKPPPRSYNPIRDNIAKFYDTRAREKVSSQNLQDSEV